MQKNSRLITIITLLICVIAAGFYVDANAQSGKSINGEFLKSMEWRSIGPNRGGRSVAVTGLVGDRNVYYFGGTGGGLWKTVDGGKNWEPVLDDVGVGSVGAIGVSESDPNVIYVGTGEHCLRGNISHGDGIYKSTDAGETWKNVGLKESRHVGEVLVHPQNPDIVYVASLGHVYAPAGEFRGDYGVFKSIDGGGTWKKVLDPPNNITGAIDLVFDPSNPRILYASLWEVFRTSYSMSSGGPGSGLYKSTDSGETWTKITGGGLPDTILGRIGVAVSPANSNFVYAMVEADEGGLFRSQDAGKTWQRVNQQRNLRQRAWYYTHIYADPVNPMGVYVLNTGMYRSIDGGANFESIGRGIHGDHHALWIDPLDPLRMIAGNDGGANVTVDGATTWTDSEQPTAQFYHVYTDDDFPYNVYGAQQDNSTVKTSSRTNGGDLRAWYPVGGGESGHIVPDPRNSDIVYAGSYGGLITRYDHRTKTSQNIQAWPDNPMGWGAADLKYRFQWTAPIMISKHDPTKLYHASNVLFRSTNEGMSWEQVSPDLTTNDKSKQQKSGGPITNDDTSVEYYCTIFALAESPITPGLIWAGSDDGLMHITRDDAKTWTNITPKNMPEWSLISSVEPSYFDAGTAYIAVDRHELDDYGAYAYKTTNYGKSWKPINKGFRENDFLRVIRQDPVVEEILYAGTEMGVYYSIDDGESWHSLQLNLPNVPVHDLSVKMNDLVAGTHGRSFWILDDLTVIHQLRNEKMNSDKLLKPRPGYNGPGFGSVDIHFYIKDETKETTLEILDSGGGLIEKYSTTGKPGLDAKQGMNKFAWNMRYPGAVTVPGHPMWAASTAGPTAVPGTYAAKLTNDGKSQSVDFEIKMNPNLVKYHGTTQAGLQEQFDFLLKIRNKVTEAHEAVLQLRAIKTDLAAIKKRVADNDSWKSIADKADETTEKLSAVEAKILQVKSQSSQDPLNYPILVNNKIAALNGSVSRSYNRPTKQAYEVFDMLSAEFAGYKTEFDAIVNRDVADLNRLVENANIPAVIIKK